MVVGSSSHRKLIGVAAVVMAALAALLVVAIGNVFGSEVAAGSSPTQLRPPAVAPQAIAAVHAAEANARAELHGPGRSLVEGAQSTLAELAPSLAAELNFSAGEFGLKPKTVAALHQYAINCGYVSYNCDPTQFAEDLTRQATSPEQAQVQVALLLDFYKTQHPKLSTMSWAQIGNDDSAIAKLYSAYAGGDQDLALWQSTDEPGPVAKTRLGYCAKTGTFSVLDQIQG